MILSLLDTDDCEKKLSFDDLLKQKTLTLLYFYPKDNTPGCSIQANEFTALSEEFGREGVQIIGVSKDTIASHRTFCQDHHLKIILVSDSELVLHKRFATLGEKKIFGKLTYGTVRSSFVLDET